MRRWGGREGGEKEVGERSEVCQGKAGPYPLPHGLHSHSSGLGSLGRPFFFTARACRSAASPSIRTGPLATAASRALAELPERVGRGRGEEASRKLPSAHWQSCLRGSVGKEASQQKPAWCWPWCICEGGRDRRAAKVDPDIGPQCIHK